MAVVHGQTIRADDLPIELTEATPALVTRSSNEKDTLRATLEANHWNRDLTARALGISRTTPWRKMREAGLVQRVST